MHYRLGAITGNSSIRNREDRYRFFKSISCLLVELGWNHDRNRPFREMTAVFFIYNFISEKQCEGHDASHPSPKQKAGSTAESPAGERFGLPPSSYGGEVTVSAIGGTVISYKRQCIGGNLGGTTTTIVPITGGLWSFLFQRRKLS